MSKQDFQTVRLHRFRDTIGIDIGQGKTEYLSPPMVHALIEQLESASCDLINRPFALSTFQTVTLKQDVRDSVYSAVSINKQS